MLGLCVATHAAISAARAPAGGNAVRSFTLEIVAGKRPRVVKECAPFRERIVDAVRGSEDQRRVGFGEDGG